MVLAPGARLSAYEIVSLLGAGGMGEVYLARDPRLGRNVAIKVLPQALATDPGRLRRFEYEARAVAALNHPNILAVHDIGQHEGLPYIVMEYVEGETLSASLRREPVPCTRSLEIGTEIAEALAAAHRQGIVHRDLKPGNVMVMPDGHIKVLDFGLAKSLAFETATTTLDGSTIDSGGTLVGQVLGTPGYMSPEQLHGKPTDNRTDIYSLGVILFELLTGQRAFDNLAIDALRQATLSAPPRSVCALNASVPPAVGELVQAAMSPDPGTRPQSAVAFRDELKRLSGTGTSTPLTPVDIVARSRSTSPPARSRVIRYVSAVLAAAVAVALGGIAVSRWPGLSSSPATERPVVAVLPLTNLTGDESKAYLGVGIADTLTTSLGQLSSVSVVSRTAAQETGSPKTTDLAVIARNLGATLLVRGSVQQSADRLRVSANLVTPDGKVIWSGDSEAGLSDLFALESRLAGALVDALRINLSAAERQQLAKPMTASPEALEAYWQGTALLDRADVVDFDAAERYFQRATALDPAFSLAHASLGEVYRRRYRQTRDVQWMSKAVTEVTEAARADPMQIDVRLSLAIVYRDTGRNGAAVDELRRAIELQPSNAEAHRLLGDVLAGEGRNDEALAELRQAVNLRPQYWKNHERLGLFYMSTGNLKDAIASLTRLAQLRPDEASPYQQLGAAYQMTGDNARARQNYERSISLRPNPASYTNLGVIYYAERRYDDAARAFERAVELAPNRAPYRRNLGDVYFKLQRTADARTAYEKAVQLAEEALAVNPNDAPTLSQLGVYKAKLGKRDEAVRNATTALGLNPASPDVAYGLAVVHALNGETDQAIGRLKEAISRGYSKQLALEDDDLASLRALPAFQALVKSPQ